MRTSSLIAFAKNAPPSPVNHLHPSKSPHNGEASIIQRPIGQTTGWFQKCSRKHAPAGCSTLEVYIYALRSNLVAHVVVSYFANVMYTMTPLWDTHHTHAPLVRAHLIPNQTPVSLHLCLGLQLGGTRRISMVGFVSDAYD
jgi:hypothetical protein